jgi:hypothetical protein
VLVLQACIGPYFESVRGNHRTPWKLREEAFKIEGFAAAFFKHIDETLCINAGSGIIRDPLTNGRIAL